MVFVVLVLRFSASVSLLISLLVYWPSAMLERLVVLRNGDEFLLCKQLVHVTSGRLSSRSVCLVVVVVMQVVP